MQSALFFEFSRTIYSKFLHNSLHNVTDILKVKLIVLHLSIFFSHFSSFYSFLVNILIYCTSFILCKLENSKVY